MAAKTYATAGNTALKGISAPHLTLVYDRNTATANRRCNAHTKGPRVRTTCSMRGMLVCAIAFAVITFGFAMAISGFRGLKTTQMLDDARIEEVRVVSGDTLWSIADRCVGATVSTEEAMKWITTHNDIGSSALKPGQRLCVPVLQ